MFSSAKSATTRFSLPAMAGANTGARTYRTFIRAALPAFLLCCLTGAALTVGAQSAWAQTGGANAATGAAGTTGATTDVAQLISDLNDIDTMRPLIPLKLTPEELDRMISVISAVQTDYDKKFKAIAGPALVKLADQIRDVKQRTLKGEAIPKDFDALAKQAEAEIISKRKTLDADTLVSVATSLESILTPDQIKLAARLDRDAQTRLGKATPNTQRTEDQWFGLYVKDAVITVPRIVAVLKQMRAAVNAKTASNASAGTAGK